MNAEQFVLDLLKSKTLTTAQINEAWKKAGRGGVANNSLGTLAKAKKVKRAAVKGGRGTSTWLFVPTAVCEGSQHTLNLALRTVSGVEVS